MSTVDCEMIIKSLVNRGCDDCLPLPKWILVSLVTTLNNIFSGIYNHLIYSGGIQAAPSLHKRCFKG